MELYSFIIKIVVIIEEFLPNKPSIKLVKSTNEAVNLLPFSFSNISAWYSVTIVDISISNTCRRSYPTTLYSPSGSELLSTLMIFTSSGSSTAWSVVPLCPFCPFYFSFPLRFLLFVLWLGPWDGELLTIFWLISTLFLPLIWGY